MVQVFRKIMNGEEQGIPAAMLRPVAKPMDNLQVRAPETSPKTQLQSQEHDYLLSEHKTAFLWPFPYETMAVSLLQGFHCKRTDRGIWPWSYFNQKDHERPSPWASF